MLPTKGIHCPSSAREAVSLLLNYLDRSVAQYKPLGEQIDVFGMAEESNSTAFVPECGDAHSFEI